MNDRFTEKARNAIEKARAAAMELGHSYIGTEHLLLGIVCESDGLGSRVLRENGFEEDLVLDLIEKAVGRGAPGMPVQGLTPRCKRVIEIAVAEANRLRHSYVGTEHLLMGILREPESTAAHLLIAAGGDLNKIYTDVFARFTSSDYRAAARSGGVGQRAPVRHAETKNLDQYSRDLTEMAARGELDPVIGRDKEIARVIQILSRRSKNNPVLIGEPGVGKTAVAEGLAQRVAHGEVPENLRDKRIVSLDLTGMLAGTKYRGDFEDRLKNVLKEVGKAKDVVLFIDELHTVIGAGAAEGAIDAANILKPALSRGEIQIVGATTLSEYRKHIEKDAAFERRFQPVTVAEPTEEESIQILRGLRDRYETHHGLKIMDEALTAAVKLSTRYISDRFLPDKAIDLVDEAASRVRMENLTAPDEMKTIEAKLSTLAAQKEEAVRAQDYELAAQLRDRERSERGALEKARGEWDAERGGHRGVVSAEDIAAVVSGWTGIPVTSLTESESERLLHMEDVLHRRVIGQNEAVAAVARAIRRGRVGLKDPHRPVGSFLFLGPTGVGKTELCRALAEAMFGDENAMIRVDMSEYMEKHTVSKLIGSPPGYVGFDEGGQLTEKVRRKPYSVVLFDEIEKAHEDVFNLLLQIMDDGRLTDSQGRTVDFRNTVIVMTSNIGARAITDRRTALGFSGLDGTPERSYAEIREAVTAELKKTFRPEFLNRIDEIIVFHRLTGEDIRAIAANIVQTVALRAAALGVHLTVTEEAIAKLAEAGYDPDYGARPLRRTVQTQIEDPLAEALLTGELSSGGEAEAIVDEEGHVAVRAKGALTAS